MSEIAASFLRRPTGAALCNQCDPEPPLLPPKACIEPGDFSSHLQFGGNYTHVRLTPGGFNSYNGNLGGGQALYEFRTCRRIYGGLSVRWRQGKISGILGNGTLRDGTAEERIGNTFGRNAYLFSLYTGFGFRYIEQDLQPKGSPSVKFKYEEFYVPIGFLYDCQFSSNFNWGLYGAWMPQVYPSVTIEPIGGCHWIVEKTWKNAILAMPFTFACNPSRSFTIVFKPFFEYWQDGKTTAKSVIGEPLGVPRNTYLFGGADLNICYSF
ncbi:MAG: hypothetical protein IT584_01530 [Chlamydiae bacterium]|nr:hypothetical protein [Chlamydiota bacterium]